MLSVVLLSASIYYSLAFCSFPKVLSAHRISTSMLMSGDINHSGGVGIVVAADEISSGSRAPSKTPVTLITFDVDGTLVKGTNKGPQEVTAHSRAFIFAAAKIFSSEDEKFTERFSTPLQIIPSDRYHGCTDGLIMLNIAKYAFGIEAADAFPRLSEAFRTMYEYIAALTDEEVSSGIKTLPGVERHLSQLASDPALRAHTICGLVTGNVEGIARKKMRACGIFQLGALAPPAVDQSWNGENEFAFLGGFGSDFCSGDTKDLSRIYKDRGEQIIVAYQRACNMLQPHQQLVRVVHVGDAPADILAAKWCSEEGKFHEGVCVGCVGVATGSYSAEQLQQLAGEAIAGRWEPVVLSDGMGDESFIKACGIVLPTTNTP